MQKAGAGMTSNYIVVGIGEILWDVFPEWRRMGGAPVNFAYMCNQMGARGIPVSCIGRDEAGSDMLIAVTTLGLESGYIQECATAPTGSVNVTLDHHQKPTYEIRRDVAWDLIVLSEKLQRLAPNVDAVCFGTLAQREEISKSAIQTFVKMSPDIALKIFDVNLRQNFFSKQVIESSLELANVLKVSDEELPVLASMFQLKGEVFDKIRQLQDRFNLRLVAYTRGADGSMLVTRDDVVDHPGFKPNAIDTVGAGDSYTATICMGLLRQLPLDVVINHASRVAAFVCEQEGATPVLPDDVRSNLEAAKEE